MKKFTKGLLNYFAAYSETRFQFTAKSVYKWSDDNLTADFSVFPKFQKLIIEIIKQKGQLSLKVKPREYEIVISEADFRKHLIERLDNSFDVRFVVSCIQQAKDKMGKTDNDKVIIAGEAGNVVGVTANKDFE